MMRFILLLFVTITNLILSNTQPYEFNGVGIDNPINTPITQNIFLTDEYNQAINLKIYLIANQQL